MKEPYAYVVGYLGTTPKLLGVAYGGNQADAMRDDGIEGGYWPVVARDSLNMWWGKVDPARELR